MFHHFSCVSTKSAGGRGEWGALWCEGHKKESSLVSRLHPAARCFMREMVKSWVEPGDKANGLIDEEGIVITVAEFYYIVDTLETRDSVQTIRVSSWQG